MPYSATMKPDAAVARSIDMDLAGTPKNLQGNKRDNAIRDGGDQPVESSLDTQERTERGR